jgi:hypothetical protein
MDSLLRCGVCEPQKTNSSTICKCGQWNPYISCSTLNSNMWTPTQGRMKQRRTLRCCRHAKRPKWRVHANFQIKPRPHNWGEHVTNQTVKKCILFYQKFHHRLHKSLPPSPTVGQSNLVHTRTLIPLSTTLRGNIILSSTPRLPQWLHP